ncbi:hypothetical protein SBADM41S_02497 [Streptomyces badius]
MFYTCNYNIRVTHRNGAIKHIFYTNQIHGGIISRLFFIHFVAPCACSSIALCLCENSTSLVRACVERARSTEGVRALVLSTQPGMLSAHRIYRRLGFLRTPDRDWEPVPGLRLMTFRLLLEAVS